MTNVYDLNAARPAAGSNVSRAVTCSLPPCASAFGAYERRLSEMIKGGASVGDMIFAYEIAARCSHGYRVAVRVFIDEPGPIDTAMREIARRMCRKHGIRDHGPLR